MFFKTADPDALLGWYEQHLGVRRTFPTGIEFTWCSVPAPAADSPPASAAASPGSAAGPAAGAPGTTVLGLFSSDTTYFAPSRAD